MRALSLFLLLSTQVCLAQTGDSLIAPGQANLAYTVDPAVAAQVQAHMTSENKLSLGSVYVEILENDSNVMGKELMAKPLPCMIITQRQGDTVLILGHVGMFTGFGFLVALFGDSCIVYQAANSDAPMYKLHKNDSLQFGVDVPCLRFSVTLANKPHFTKGEVIDGIVRLSSEEYYEVGNDGEKRVRMNIYRCFYASAPGIGGQRPAHPGALEVCGAGTGKIDFWTISSSPARISPTPRWTRF
jgi:hypothetical protein